MRAKWYWCISRTSPGKGKDRNSRQREQLRQRPRGKESCRGRLEESSSLRFSSHPHAVRQPSSLCLAQSLSAVTSLVDDRPPKSHCFLFPPLSPNYYWLLSSQRDSLKSMTQIVLHSCLKHSRGFHSHLE